MRFFRRTNQPQSQTERLRQFAIQAQRASQSMSLLAENVRSFQHRFPLVVPPELYDQFRPEPPDSRTWFGTERIRGWRAWEMSWGSPVFDLDEGWSDPKVQLLPLSGGDPWLPGRNEAHCTHDQHKSWWVEMPNHRTIVIHGKTMGTQHPSMWMPLPPPGQAQVEPQEPPEPTPAFACTCGFWAYKDKTTLHERLGVPHAARVFGEVEMWGRVIEHTIGYRAQYARIVQLWCSPGLSKAERCALAEYYQCPVSRSYRPTLLPVALFGMTLNALSWVIPGPLHWTVFGLGLGCSLYVMWDGAVRLVAHASDRYAAEIGGAFIEVGRTLGRFAGEVGEALKRIVSWPFRR